MTAMPITSTACDHVHTGDHLLMWNAYWGGSDQRVCDTVEDAAHHAVDAAPDAVEVFEAVVARTRTETPAGQGTARTNCVAVTDREYTAVAHVVGTATEYMASNGYADDLESPEDAHTARLLGTGGGALACWAGRLS